jgi:hypothetical protein
VDMLLLYWCWVLDRLSFSSVSGRSSTVSWGRGNRRDTPQCQGRDKEGNTGVQIKILVYLIVLTEFK